MELVQIDKKKNQTVTTSRQIAEAFNKQHKNVIQKLETLECSEEFTELNFQPSEYIDSTGRKLKEYTITRDGFMFVVMGFTGKKAARIKENYIGAFNYMEEELRKIYAEPSALPPVRELFQTLQGLATDLGYSPSTANVRALSIVDTQYPELSALKLLDGNVSSEQERLLTPTELGRESSITPQTVNFRLTELGYQFRNEKKEWVLTDAGKTYGVYMDLKRRHAEGTVRCIRWKSTVLPQIM